MTSNQQLIDDQDHKPKAKLTTIQLLITSGIILGVCILLSILQDKVSFIRRHFDILEVLGFGSTIVNILGFIFGIGEYKLNRKKALIGIFGNLLLMLVVISIVAYTFRSDFLNETY